MRGKRVGQEVVMVQAPKCTGGLPSFHPFWRAEAVRPLIFVQSHSSTRIWATGRMLVSTQMYRTMVQKTRWMPTQHQIPLLVLRNQARHRIPRPWFRFCSSHLRRTYPFVILSRARQMGRGEVNGRPSLAPLPLQPLSRLIQMSGQHMMTEQG